jgi:FkbM family methyltransferase
LPSAGRQRLRRALFEWLHLTWTTRQGIQLRVANYNEWIIYNETFVDGEYDEAIRQAIDRAPAGRTLCVLDLGANVGFFTLRLFDRVRARGRNERACEVVLVEADPSLVPALDARLHRDNALGASIRLLHGVVGATAPLFYPSAASPGEGALQPSPGRRPVHVPLIDLDRETARFPEIDLVKCDIEGAELAFIERHPDLLARTASLVVEIHANRSPAAECRSRLAAAGLTREVVLRDRGGCALHLYTRV